MRLRREHCAALAAAILVACSAAASGPEVADTVPSTVGGVGVLPPAVVADTAGPSTTNALVIPSTAVPEGGSTVGERAAGNRVLMIGDSLLTSVSSRYYGELCDVAVPLGWQVQIEAEVSRQIVFAGQVLDALEVDESREVLFPSGTPPTTAPSGPDRWDAGLIFLGTNYDRDSDSYFEQLNSAIVRFGAVPVVVVLVTEYDPAMLKVNSIIEEVDKLYDNVTVIDWRAITAVEARQGNPLFDGSPPPVTAPVYDADGEAIEILTSDRIHLTDGGRAVLSQVIAGTLGQAPQGTGRCLEPVFSVDPEPLPDGNGSSGSPTSTPTQSSGGGTSPKPPKPSTPPSSSSPGSSSPPSSDAPVTTDAPPTSETAPGQEGGDTGDISGETGDGG